MILPDGQTDGRTDSGFKGVRLFEIVSHLFECNGLSLLGFDIQLNVSIFIDLTNVSENNFVEPHRTN